MNIFVFGAGTIGCYLGGKLSASGNDVVLLGRKRIGEEVALKGLVLEDLEKSKVGVPAKSVNFQTKTDVAQDTEVICVCVKSGDTEPAAQEIKKFANPDIPVISLQNGTGNRDLLKNVLPDRTVLGGMIPFNVVHKGAGHFHQTTSGEIALEQHMITDQLAKELRCAGLDCQTNVDIEAVMWGKLCLNLNNALNVLSGIPLKQQLEIRSYRLVLADCMRECLAVAKAKRIEPYPVGGVRPSIIPIILGLPTPVFRLVASRMLQIDPEARSSMWEDLLLGREPEIAYLNGEIVKEGEKLGIPTPANAMVCLLVKDAFNKGISPEMSGETLLRNIRSA